MLLHLTFCFILVLNECFERSFDRNNNGRISEKELKSLLKKYNLDDEKIDEKIKQMIGIGSKNGNTPISSKSEHPHGDHEGFTWEGSQPRHLNRRLR